MGDVPKAHPFKPQSVVATTPTCMTVQALETSNSPRYFSPNILSSSCSLIMRNLGSMDVAAHLAYAGAQDAQGEGTDCVPLGEVFGLHRGDGDAHGTS